MSPKKILVSVLGAVLILAGIAALVLPGPGLLLLLAGLVVLANEFEWAAKRVDYMRDKALSAAAVGVQTWPRVVGSAISALLVVAAGVFWGLNPQIPEVWVVGPDLPFGGWGTGGAIIGGGVIALALLAYSVKRFRFDGEPSPRDQQPQGA